MSKARKKAAGILMYRRHNGHIECLLVHPGGPFWSRKDAGVWSVPKGEYEEDEEPEAAARREFYEETGTQPEGEMTSLGSARQRSGKLVHAWALEGDLDEAQVVSNLFEMEWPSRSCRQQAFPEVDRAAWFSYEEARQKINPGQLPFIDRLEALLG